MDPDAGVETTCDQGSMNNGIIRLTIEEAKDFTITLQEIPSKAPLLYLSMNDLAACYNRKGNLHEGAIGQAWLLNGGKRLVPAQSAGDYSKGATLSVWVKLTDPSKPIPALVGWQKGGTLHYTPSKESYSFGATASKVEREEDGLEAEHAKFKGPSRNSNHGGHLGDGYLDFGNQIGEFVEWTAKIEKSGEHALRFRYASYNDRPLELKVDGETDLLSPTLSFKGSGGWTSWKYLVVKRNLTAGQHLVRLTSIKTTGPNLDRLEIIGPNGKGKIQPEALEARPVAGTPIMDDDWHLLTMSMDTKKVRVYLDGKLHQERPRNTDESMPGGAIALASSAKSPRFYLDELRAYERTLSLDEINRLAKSRPFTPKKQ
ncbi:MAG: LamG-like jellyroll fold domain-containing protein [Opitutales bacterium]